MSKQITNGELAEIVTGLLVGRLAHEQLDSTERYAAFMTDLAQLVCDHCGGEVAGGQADNTEDQWLIGIRANESLPDGGGVWNDYDLDGDLDGESVDVCGTRERRPPTVVVWIEGGIVQWVATDQLDMQYLVLDADTVGVHHTMEVTMENGDSAEVLPTSTLRADSLPIWVANLLKEIETR